MCVFVHIPVYAYEEKYKYLKRSVCHKMQRRKRLGLPCAASTDAQILCIKAGEDR